VPLEYSIAWLTCAIASRLDAVFPVTPGTLLAWHRKLAASKYDTSNRRKPGRPPTVPSIARLVVRLAKENPLWGYGRIHCVVEGLTHLREALARVHARVDLLGGRLRFGEDAVGPQRAVQALFGHAQEGVGERDGHEHAGVKYCRVARRAQKSRPKFAHTSATKKTLTGKPEVQVFTPGFP